MGCKRETQEKVREELREKAGSEFDGTDRERSGKESLGEVRRVGESVGSVEESEREAEAIIN